ncbi:MAG: hypothetical protein ABJN26_14430 [Stappiaceae bacterium]
MSARAAQASEVKDREILCMLRGNAYTIGPTISAEQVEALLCPNMASDAAPDFKRSIQCIRH